MLLSLASSLNSVPLPPILDRYGLKLPPAQHCLTNVNFSLVPNPPPEDSSEEDAPSEDEEDDEAEGLNGQRADNVEDNDVNEANINGGDATADATMEDAAETRGTKRSLDEDEDYD